MKKLFAILMSIMMIACFMPTMAFAEGATAALASQVTVNGTTGSEIAPVEVTINLTSETFKDASLTANTDVSTWFEGMPSGLTAKIKTDVEASGTSAVITISGEPTAKSSAAMVIKVPAEKLTGNAELTVNVKGSTYAIAEPAPAATATVDNVTISGKTGTAIAGQDIVITLNGDTFNAMNKDADVKGWFTNLPAGLDAKIKDVVTEGATKVTVTISGKPTATSSAAMTITIPAEKVAGNAAVKVTDNPAAKYNITAPSTGSGGGSYYPYTPSTPSKPAAPNSDKTKTDSTTAINAAATANKYDAAEQAEVKKILDKANADIKNAKTEAEVKAIEEAAQAEIDKILTTEEKAIVAALDNVEKRDFATKSKVITRKGGKKVIRLTWTAPDGVDVDGYEIFRSTKKNSGFGKKPYFTTSNTSYTNTKNLKPGKIYYYKVRAFVVINGERVYTDYSLKANRKL